jgi:hypothetical protein
MPTQRRLCKRAHRLLTRGGQIAYMPIVEKEPGTMKQVQVSGGPLGVARADRPRRASGGRVGPRLGTLVAASRALGQMLLAALIVETIAVASFGVLAGTTIAVLAAVVLLASSRLAFGPRHNDCG